MAKKTFKGPEAVLATWVNVLRKNVGVQDCINVPKQQLDIVELGIEQGLLKRVDNDDKLFLIVSLPETKEESDTMPPKKTKAPVEAVEANEEAPKTKKSSAKKSAAPKPVKEKSESDAPKKGRRIVFKDEDKFTVLTKFPKKEEEQAAVVGARHGSARFMIRKEMLDNKCKTFKQLREHMEEKGVSFNNVDFRFLIDSGHVSTE